MGAPMGFKRRRTVPRPDPRGVILARLKKGPQVGESLIRGLRWRRSELLGLLSELVGDGEIGCEVFAPNLKIYWLLGQAPSEAELEAVCTGAGVAGLASYRKSRGQCAHCREQAAHGRMCADHHGARRRLIGERAELKKIVMALLKKG